MTTAFYFHGFTAKVDTLKRYGPPTPPQKKKLRGDYPLYKNYGRSSVPKNMTERPWALGRRSAMGGSSRGEGF